MDKEKINAAISSMQGLNQKEWSKVRMIVDHYFRIETTKIADKLELADDGNLKKVKNEFSL